MKIKLGRLRRLIREALGAQTPRSGDMIRIKNSNRDWEVTGAMGPDGSKAQGTSYEIESDGGNGERDRRHVYAGDILNITRLAKKSNWE